MIIRLASLLFALASVTALHARIDLLLVPPVAAVSGAVDTVFTLHLNNLSPFDEPAHLPDVFIAHYASSTRRGRVRLVAVPETSGPVRSVASLTRKFILLRLLDPILGANAGEFASLRLESPETNAIMFEIAADPLAAPGTMERPSGATARRLPLSPQRDLDFTSDLDNMRRHISGYDPIYFAVGWRERFNARFQFSFKYRVFERGPSDESWERQLARDFHFAYTQTSIWDLESFSKPFYDSSYKPTLFLLHDFPRGNGSRWQFSLQGGAQHESNGKGGAAAILPRTGLASPTTVLRHPSDSRSLNTLYFAPKARWTADDNDFFVEAGARANFYLDKGENTDIQRYRGYVELTLRAGFDRGVQLSTHVRGQPNGHGSAEFNLTWPVYQIFGLKKIGQTLGGYLQVQYFNGYGESLLDYDVRRKDQLRFGMTIAR